MDDTSQFWLFHLLTIGVDCEITSACRNLEICG